MNIGDGIAKGIQGLIIFVGLVGLGGAAVAAGAGAALTVLILYCGGCLVCPDGGNTHANAYNTDGVVAIELQQKDVIGKDADLAEHV